MTIHKVLLNLGYHPNFENKLNTDWNLARVISEHKERYIVKNENGEYEAEIIGNLRFTAQSKSDFPCVGDWVLVSEFDEGKMLIHSICERNNLLERKTVGKVSDQQVIATNIDFGFIVEAVNRDFNINRFERYITICYDAKIEPILILNKTDLVSDEELSAIKNQITERIPNVDLHLISCINEASLSILKQFIKSGKTYCFLGSSGVGKSTIINALNHNEIMKTNSISESVDRGKHTTTHRQLIILEDGGIVIDNPGMREIGLTNMEDGIEMGFSSISELTEQCKFSDCEHIHEKGCAVLAALDEGLLSVESYNNYHKLKREQEHYANSIAEKRKKEKSFSKMVKQVKNKKNRY